MFRISFKTEGFIWLPLRTVTRFSDLVAIPVAVATGLGAGLSGGTAPFLNHQFVLIQTKKWLYVVAKGKRGCECFRGTHDTKRVLLCTQKQYKSAERPLQSDPMPAVWKEDEGTRYPAPIFNSIAFYIFF